MKILYDCYGLHEPVGGVSRYFTEIIKRLPSDIEAEIAVGETRNAYLQGAPFNIPKARCSLYNFLPGRDFFGKGRLYRLAAHIAPSAWPSCEVINEKRTREAIASQDYDILHLTNPHPDRVTWGKAIGRKPIVVTVHDLIPEIFRRDEKVSMCRRRLLAEAAHVIAVSEWTKRDIVRLYGIDEGKITVINHGSSFPVRDRKSSAESRGDGYILYVGKRNEYKNWEFFVKALAPLLRGERNLRILCTGRPFSADEKRFIAEAGIADRIEQRFVPDGEMPDVFANALAFVYPSLYEGFGIPILDAFATCCPAVLSRCSCFPEVAGDAASYFAPKDADGLRSCIVSLMENESLRQEMAERGLERLKLYSWEKAADETAEVYRKVMPR